MRSYIKSITPPPRLSSRHSIGFFSVFALTLLVFFSLFISCKNNETESEEDRIRKAPPTTPENVRVSTKNKTTITLLWDSVGYIGTYYDTYGVECYDESNTLIKSDTTTSTSYDFSDLTRGVTYKLRVRTNKNGQNSAWSDFVTGVPKIVGVEYSDLTSSSVTLEWEDNPLSNFEYYFVKCTEEVSGDERIIICTSRNTCTITGLCTNVEYSFSVCGQLSTKYAILGGPTLGIPYGTPALNLATPTNVRADTTGKSINVTWNSVSGATRYMVAIYKGNAFRPSSYIQTTSTSYKFTPSTTGTYKFAIRADNPNSYLYSHWSAMDGDSVY